MNQERFAARIEAFETPTGYGLKCSEVRVLIDAIRRDLYNGILLAYNYGFLRGQRQVKNDARKKAEAKKEAAV